MLHVELFPPTGAGSIKHLEALNGGSFATTRIDRALRSPPYGVRRGGRISGLLRLASMSQAGRIIRTIQISKTAPMKPEIK